MSPETIFWYFQNTRQRFGDFSGKTVLRRMTIKLAKNHSEDLPAAVCITSTEIFFFFTFCERQAKVPTLALKCISFHFSAIFRFRDIAKIGNWSRAYNIDIIFRYNFSPITANIEFKMGHGVQKYIVGDYSHSRYRKNVQLVA